MNQNMNKKNSHSVSLNQLQKKVAKFRDERNWKKHHNPKNLVISILIEAAELAEHFQWESFGEALAHRKNQIKKGKIAVELADVIIYCLSLADIMGIDPTTAIIDKLKHNRKKFPKHKVNDLNFIRRQREKYRQLEK